MHETVRKIDLEPGDVVDLELTEGWGSAIVRRAHEGRVWVWRPYATVAGFTYSQGRAIPYIGIEDFELVGGAGSTITRLRRSDIPEVREAREHTPKIACDNHWDSVVAGRVEVDQETGEIGHFVVTKDPLDPSREYVDVVYRGRGDTGNVAYNAGTAYASGYHD